MSVEIEKAMVPVSKCDKDNLSCIYHDTAGF